MPKILKTMNRGDIDAYKKGDPNPYSLLPGLNSSKFQFSLPFYNYQNPSQDLSKYQKIGKYEKEEPEKKNQRAE